MKTSKLHVTGLCEGNSPVNSPCRRPVAPKMSPFDDVIMRQQIRIGSDDGLAMNGRQAITWTYASPGLNDLTNCFTSQSEIIKVPRHPLRHCLYLVFHHRPRIVCNFPCGIQCARSACDGCMGFPLIMARWIINTLRPKQNVVFNVLGQHVMVVWDSPWLWQDGLLTHWGRNKMDAISQTTFWNVFSWMKIVEFQIKFHWNMFIGV